MKRHNLYEVDLEGLRAFCTVCGYTDIVLPKTHSNPTPKPICAARAQAIREKQLETSEIAREKKRTHHVKHQHHSLSSIDPEARTAICEICGPTDVWKGSKSSKGKIRYICGTYSREYFRKYKREHSKGRSTKPHSLSQVDEEAGTAVCATCGPVKVEIRLVNKYVTIRCINAPGRKARKKE